MTLVTSARRWPIGTHRLAKAAVLGLAVVLLVGQPIARAQTAAATTNNHTISSNTKTRVLIHVQQILQKYAFVPGVDFETLPNILKAEQERIDKASTDMEFTIAVNSALRKYGISHINLFTPNFGEQRKTQQKPGLGIRLEDTPKGMVITQIVKGGAAEEAGMHVGDLILTCDGRPVKTVDDLAGEDGQKSSVVVRRSDGKNDKEISFEVTRHPFSLVIPEKIQWKGDTAIVTIPSFDNAYDRENVDKIMTEALKAKSLVLDLRSNGGGRVTNLLHLAGYFIPSDQAIGKWVSKQTVINYEKTHPKTTDVAKLAESSQQEVNPLRPEAGMYKGPVAVLINGGTGSASEMMAAALVELRGAETFGTKSAGAVLASIMREIDGGEGFWIQYPLFDYVTIQGMHLEGKGLKPNVERPTPRFGEADSGLEAALNWLNT
ncbi:MAG: S41 family peptidase, partial [Armatimonadota bacterium]